MLDDDNRFGEITVEICTRTLHTRIVQPFQSTDSNRAPGPGVYPGWPKYGIVNLSYSERVRADWRRGVRNRQAAVTLRQTSKDRDLKSR
jgi:hypothetical protein